MFGLTFIIITLSIAMLPIMCGLRRSWLLVLLYVTSLFLITFYMVFIFKTGGYRSSVENLLVFPKALASQLSYVRIPLSTLYYMMTLSRLLVPFLLLSNVLYLRQDRFEHTRSYIARYLLLLLPLALFAIIKEPSLFVLLLGKHFALQTAIQILELLLLFSYCAIAIFLVSQEANMHELAHVRNQNTHFLVATATLSLVFAFFALMDPVFIIQDYTTIRVGPFTYFLNSKIDPFAIGIITVLIGTTVLVNFLAMLKYSQVDFNRNLLDLKVRKNLREAQLLTGGLIHGLKNQILTEKIILDNLLEHLNNDQGEKGALELALLLDREYQSSLNRLNIVYQSLRDFDTHLILGDLSDLMEDVQKRARQTYPNTLILFTFTKGRILIDQPLFSEALMNIISNAVDAVADKADGYVCIDASFTRKHCVITVIDNGGGIPKQLQKSLFLPFVSNKNRQHNWGLGLCYARLVTQKHFGEIQFETSEESGTTFTISIPRLFIQGVP